MTAGRILAILLLVSLGGCGGGDTVQGIVVEVRGDLEDVESFTVRTPGGETLTFVPAPDLRFHDGPLSHLRQHVISGQPVEIEYITDRDEGDLVAMRIGDA